MESYLHRYHELQQQVEEIDNELITLLHPGKAQPVSGGGGVSYRSDPTATHALRRMELADRRQKLSDWLQVIERLIDRYRNDHKGTLLELCYFSDLAENYICEKLAIDRATYYRWRSELVLYAALLSVQSGLIKIA